MKSRRIIIRVPSVSNSKFEQNIPYECIRAKSNPDWTGAIAWKDGDITHVVKQGRKRHAHGNFFDVHFVFRKAPALHEINFTEMNNDGAWKAGSKNFTGEDGHKKPKAKPVAPPKPVAIVVNSPTKARTMSAEERQALIDKYKADKFSKAKTIESDYISFDQFGEPNQF